MQVTASFGCTQLESRDTSLDDVVERADKALYQSKENGRNRVTAIPALLASAITEAEAQAVTKNDEDPQE